MNMAVPRTIQNAKVGAAVNFQNAEVVALTISPAVFQAPTQQVNILAQLNITLGTGITAVTVRVRRLSLTGTNILAAALVVNVTASQATSIPVFAAEEVDNGDYGTYVVTVQGTGATGNSSVTDGVGLALVY
jgi:hypothetical protein